MKKTWKYILGSATGLTGTALAIVSCGQSSNPFYDKKEIVVSSEANQEDFWKAVQEEFKTTDSYKKGYTIKIIQKDVFGSIDFLVSTGFTDENASDLIYSPQDRIISLIGSKSIKVWNDELKNKILTNINATNDEIDFVNKFGEFEEKINNNSGKKFFNFVHNKEGIVMMSKQTLEEVKKTLSNDSTNEMVELSKEGLGFFRIQDFWYGNGILGGILNDNELKKMIYRDIKSKKWSSGFLKTDANHAKYKEAIKIASELMYPWWKAAYDEEFYNSSKFKEKGITQGDIKTLLSSDMGAVQNKVLELISDGKLKYAMTGSWDIGTASKRGINTFFNFPKLKGDSEFKQASGSWSWAINARNNGVSKGREQALEDAMLSVFKISSYKGYFDKDSKIPFFKDAQDKLKEKLDIETEGYKKEITSFANNNGFADLNNFLEKYDSRTNEFLNLLNVSLGRDSKSWQVEVKSKLLEVYKEEIKIPNSLKNNNDETIQNLIKKIEAFEIKEATGLRNAIATLLGMSNLNELSLSGKAWLVSSDSIKENSSWDEALLDGDKKDKLAHLRKIEESIFGVNGDQAGSRDDIYKEIQKNEQQALQKVIKNAKEFSSKYSKIQVAENKIIEAATKYFNNYINEANWLKNKETAKSDFGTSAFKKADDSTDSGKTFAEVQKIVEKYRNGNVATKIVDVITSTKSLSEQNGLGKLETQKSRLDNNNPQFGSVWANWNDQTFGSATFYQGLNKNLNQEEFTEKIIDKLHELFDAKTKALDAAKEVDFIDYSKK